MKFKVSKQAFTLLELLVAISIIGILSSVVLASLNSARSGGRDAKRVSEVKQLQTALELFYLDNGYYPHGTWIESVDASWENNTNYLATALAPYMPDLPEDPINFFNTGTQITSSTTAGPNYSYSYFAQNYPASTPSTDQQWYMLLVNLESDHSIEGIDGVDACAANSQTYPTAIAPPSAGSQVFHYGNGSTRPNMVTVGGNCTKF